jgi:hypothetical protein
MLAPLVPAAAELKAVPLVAEVLSGWGAAQLTHAEYACKLAALSGELAACIVHLTPGAYA